MRAQVSNWALEEMVYLQTATASGVSSVLRRPGNCLVDQHLIWTRTFSESAVVSTRCVHLLDGVECKFVAFLVNFPLALNVEILCDTG